MKKISTKLASELGYVRRPFALRNHIHEDYLLKDTPGLQTVAGDILFTGAVSGVTAGVSVDKNPTFEYTGNQLTKVLYSSGNYKIIVYTGNLIDYVSYIPVTGDGVKKQFIYNPDNTINNIVESVIPA